MREMVKCEIEDCFIERLTNTIDEKISYCIKVKKMNPDDAIHLITQVVKNLSDQLLPLKTKYPSKNFSSEVTVNVH